MELEPFNTNSSLSERLQLWASLLISTVSTMASTPPRILWTDLYQRVRVSNTADLAYTMTIQLQKTVSRLPSVLIAQWWSNRPCIGQNTMIVVFGLRPLSTQPTCTIIPHTLFLDCLLLKCVPSASRLVAPSSMPINFASVCTSFVLVYRVE